MEIIINGIHANLRFSSAHMIPQHKFCGGIHGHSYHVDVKVEGIRSGEFGFVVDFKKIKGMVRQLCSKLDHKMLIPLKNDKIEFKNLKESVEFSIDSKKYLLPIADCCLLPLKSTSAEELAEYFAKDLYKSLKENEDGFSKVKIWVNEGIGQGACYIQEAK